MKEEEEKELEERLSRSEVNCEESEEKCDDEKRNGKKK